MADRGYMLIEVPIEHRLGPELPASALCVWPAVPAAARPAARSATFVGAGLALPGVLVQTREAGQALPLQFPFSSGCETPRPAQPALPRMILRWVNGAWEHEEGNAA
jgi:hypothetical protein